MTVKIRFFARFRELLGTDIVTDVAPGTKFTSLITSVARKNREGYAAIFDETGAFHEFVILMKNGKRIEIADADKTVIVDGDEIAVFPPVAGG
ncbi:MAG TPA: MoaD family protein [Methanoregula sp.]|nr:MoaD family protein [Methanoregula sp.]